MFTVNALCIHVFEFANNNLLCFSAHPKLEYENKLKAKQLVKVGQSISLQVNISGIPNPTVQWAQNGTVIEKSPKISIETTDVFSMLTVKNASLDDTGVYSITAENVVGKAQAKFDVAIRGKYTDLCIKS